MLVAFFKSAGLTTVRRWGWVDIKCFFGGIVGR
jgi:hypothetical protein